MTSPEQFLHDVTDWAAAQPDIAAVVLVGSHARGAARPDSDVDVVILATAPRRYLDDTGWVGRFGAVQRRQAEDYGKLTSLRVWYADGPEVEFGLTDPTWGSDPLDAGTQRVIADGMRVLFERAGSRAS
jgi:hypothetical protein